MSRPTLSPSVLEIRVTPDCDARKTVESHSIGLPPGSFVRLMVGNTPAPLWLGSVLRPDLNYQIVATHPRVIADWESACGVNK